MNTRPLAAEERSVLDFLLKQEFPGRDELLVQAESVQTGGLSCTCGCPSFSLVPNRSLPPRRCLLGFRLKPFFAASPKEAEESRRVRAGTFETRGNALVRWYGGEIEGDREGTDCRS